MIVLHSSEAFYEVSIGSFIYEVSKAKSSFYLNSLGSKINDCFREKQEKFIHARQYRKTIYVGKVEQSTDLNRYRNYCN